MDVWGIVAFVLVVFFIVTISFAWISFFKSKHFERSLNRLTAQVEKLNGSLDDAQRQISILQSKTTSGEDPSSQSQEIDDLDIDLDHLPTQQNEVVDQTPHTKDKAFEEDLVPAKKSDPWRTDPSRKASDKTAPKQPSFFDRIVSSIKDKWMVWLGGVCVGLSGIFLVKYSIDQGLLGPTARISLAVMMGIGFHALAAYLQPRFKQHIEVISALAGGASITLYAALLAALHLYQLLPAEVVFLALATISILTMLLAFQYGPLLAAIGILGAYAVPILVNTGSNNVAVALIYSGIITLSALVLFRWIFRRWLWIGVILASCAWWVIAFIAHVEWSVSGGYLIVMLYAIVAIHKGDWWLSLKYPLEDADHIFAALKTRVLTLDADERYRACVISLTTLAWVAGFTVSQFNFLGLVALFAYPAILLWLCVNRPILTLAALLASLGYIVLMCIAHFGHYPAFDQLTLTQILIGLGVIFSLGGGWNLKHSRFTGFWVLFTSLAPLVTLALAYLMILDFASDKQWAVIAVIIALVYTLIAKKMQAMRLSDSAIASLLIAAHVAYSLAVVIYLDEARLTLAIAIQTISLAYLSKHYRLPLLAPCLKVIVALVIVRLTFNPYLAEYELTPHWPLWVIGGPLLCCAISWWMLIQREPRLSFWLQGASLHLLALTVISETRYLLYDGNVFILDFTQKEAAVNTLTWGALGLVYLYRARMAHSIGWLYTIASIALLGGAALNYGAGLLLVFNPLYYKGAWLSDTPIFNALLLMYFVPSILLAIGAFLAPKTLWRQTAVAAAASVFIWINLEIRHLWHGSDMLVIRGVLQGELYTYSVVWLALAIAILACAIKLNRVMIYRAGMLVLMGVVAKIFLFDMSALTGLLRVTSFLALGLCLLGIAVLHQKLGQKVGSE